MALQPGQRFASLDYYRALFDNPKMNSVLLIDPNGIILQTNRAFLIAFGYEKADVEGRNFSILFSEEDKKRDMPGRELSTVLDEGQSFDNNYLVNKNGNLTWVSGESILITNERNEKFILKVIQNIHTQKEAEYAIVRLNSFNENILSSIEDAVIVLDNELKVLKANRSFTATFNFSAQEVSTIDFREFMRSFDLNAELYNAIIGTIQSKACVSKVQLDLETGDSDKKTFDISCSKLEGSDAYSHILLVFHDITAQKHFEKQREDILNFVAHELRNPLTNVILNIEMMDELQKQQEQDDFRDFIDRSKKNAQRLKKLINELYKTTKLISGNFDPEGSLFDFEEMIDETTLSIQPIHPGYNIIKKSGGPVMLFADRDKLIQVVTNYLTNAIKYSDGNTDIEIEIKSEEAEVVFSVKDYGRGIRAKDLPYIFNRFFRAENTKSLEGLGLGLFLSRQIIEAHHGRTWVESAEGQGSTFYFSLPLTNVNENNE